jgi:ABC-type glycerol-3-phosphate transport system permease component
MMKRESIITKIIYLLLVVAVALPFLLPFAWLASTAFKPSAQIFSIAINFIPVPATLEHFRRVLDEFHFAIYLRNTVVITLGTVIGVIVSSCPVAYAFSMLDWPDRKLTFSLSMMTMMLPPQVTMIPVFLIFRQLGWIDTFLPLIVPFFLGNAFYIFLLRQFFLSFPMALIESARIDGAMEPRILVSIVMPLCKPALLTVVLFAGIGAWNDFFGPLIYLFTEEKKTLALALQSLVGEYASEWGMLVAIFLAAQKYFIQGIALSGLKG